MPKSNKRAGNSDMTDTEPIRRIAIIGTGVIGASWTALYLAKCPSENILNPLNRL